MASIKTRSFMEVLSAVQKSTPILFMPDEFALTLSRLSHRTTCGQKCLEFAEVCLELGMWIFSSYR
jgi:hypothetical protein